MSPLTVCGSVLQITFTSRRPLRVRASRGRTGAYFAGLVGPAVGCERGDAAPWIRRFAPHTGDVRRQTDGLIGRIGGRLIGGDSATSLLAAYSAAPMLKDWARDLVDFYTTPVCLSGGLSLAPWPCLRGCVSGRGWLRIRRPSPGFAGRDCRTDRPVVDLAAEPEQHLAFTQSNHRSNRQLSSGATKPNLRRSG